MSTDENSSGPMVSRQNLDSRARDESPQREHILQFFEYGHLPPHLQDVSLPFYEMAERVMRLPRNPERTVALRKLLEAKDAAVRAAIAK